MGTGAVASENINGNNLDTIFQRIWYDENFVHDRLGKKIQFTVEPIGIDYFAEGLTRGLTIGFFLSPEKLIYLQGKKSMQLTQYSNTTHYEKINSIDLGLRSYIKNSLYLSTGLSKKTIFYSMKSSGLSSPKFNGLAEFVTEAAIINIGLGNQWQWQNFSFGIEWLNLAIPFADKLKTEKIEEYQSEFSRENVQYFKKSKNNLTKSTNWSALNISLGLAF